MKRKKNRKERDSDFGVYLRRVCEEIEAQNASDREAVLQANRIYSHRDSVAPAVSVHEEIKKLPTLAHVHMQEFAFRYATENRSVTAWASIFNVSTSAISAWLKRKDVQQFITALRRNRFLRLSAARTRLDLVALEEMHKLIVTPTTEENYAAKAKLILAYLSFSPSPYGQREARRTAEHVLRGSEEPTDVPRIASDITVQSIIPSPEEVAEIEEVIAIT